MEDVPQQVVIGNYAAVKIRILTPDTKSHTLQTGTLRQSTRFSSSYAKYTTVVVKGVHKTGIFVSVKTSIDLAVAKIFYLLPVFQLA